MVGFLQEVTLILVQLQEIILCGRMLRRLSLSYICTSLLTTANGWQCHIEGPRDAIRAAGPR